MIKAKGVKARLSYNDISKRYFEWLAKKAMTDSHERHSKLLELLHSIQFTYLFDRDSSRAKDGIALRYEFVQSYYHHGTDIPLGDAPCTVLEMMLGLAWRIDEHIMRDPEFGDRTSLWFSEMLDSLELSGMTDDIFDEVYARRVITRLLKRQFRADGRGSLFTIPNTVKDMREVEIWDAAMMHLRDVWFNRR